eukprot:Hpha_TRINITY_DN15783_c2_g2::TRINITY_DN15783_c2_g2_i1::g.38208::m.38208
MVSPLSDAGITEVNDVNGALSQAIEEPVEEFVSALLAAVTAEHFASVHGLQEILQRWSGRVREKQSAHDWSGLIQLLNLGAVLVRAQGEDADTVVRHFLPTVAEVTRSALEGKRGDVLSAAVALFTTDQGANERAFSEALVVSYAPLLLSVASDTTVPVAARHAAVDILHANVSKRNVTKIEATPLVQVLRRTSSAPLMQVAATLLRVLATVTSKGQAPAKAGVMRAMEHEAASLVSPFKAFCQNEDKLVDFLRKAASPTTFLGELTSVGMKGEEPCPADGPLLMSFDGEYIYFPRELVAADGTPFMEFGLRGVGSLDKPTKKKIVVKCKGTPDRYVELDFPTKEEHSLAWQTLGSRLKARMKQARGTQENVTQQVTQKSVEENLAEDIMRAIQPAAKRKRVTEQEDSKAGELLRAVEEIALQQYSEKEKANSLQVDNEFQEGQERIRELTADFKEQERTLQDQLASQKAQAREKLAAMRKLCSKHQKSLTAQREAENSIATQLRAAESAVEQMETQSHEGVQSLIQDRKRRVSELRKRLQNQAQTKLEELNNKSSADHIRQSIFSKLKGVIEQERTRGMEIDNE